MFNINFTPAGFEYCYKINKLRFNQTVFVSLKSCSRKQEFYFGLEIGFKGVM